MGTMQTNRDISKTNLSVPRINATLAIFSVSVSFCSVTFCNNSS